MTSPPTSEGRQSEFAAFHAGARVESVLTVVAAEDHRRRARDRAFELGHQEIASLLLVGGELQRLGELRVLSPPALRPSGRSLDREVGHPERDQRQETHDAQDDPGRPVFEVGAMVFGEGGEPRVHASIAVHPCFAAVERGRGDRGTSPTPGDLGPRFSEPGGGQPIRGPHRRLSLGAKSGFALQLVGRRAIFGDPVEIWTEEPFAPGQQIAAEAGLGVQPRDQPFLDQALGLRPGLAGISLGLGPKPDGRGDDCHRGEDDQSDLASAPHTRNR
jgi:hypothetical protein